MSPTMTFSYRSHQWWEIFSYKKSSAINFRIGKKTLAVLSTVTSSCRKEFLCGFFMQTSHLLWLFDMLKLSKMLVSYRKISNYVAFPYGTTSTITIFLLFLKKISTQESHKTTSTITTSRFSYKFYQTCSLIAIVATYVRVNYEMAFKMMAKFSVLLQTCINKRIRFCICLF